MLMRSWLGGGGGGGRGHNTIAHKSFKCLFPAKPSSQEYRLPGKNPSEEAGCSTSLHNKSIFGPVIQFQKRVCILEVKDLLSAKYCPTLVVYHAVICCPKSFVSISSCPQATADVVFGFVALTFCHRPHLADLFIGQRIPRLRPIYLKRVFL